MISINSLINRLLRLRRSALFRSPAHLLPAISVILVVLLSIVSFILPVSGPRLSESPASQLVASIRGIYNSLGIPYDDEFSLTSETDTVRIEEGDEGINRNVLKKTVLKGDSVYSILTASGLSHREALELSHRLKNRQSIRDFKPGMVYEIETNTDNSFSSLSWHLSRTEVLHLEKDEHSGELNVWQETLQSETRIAKLEGRIGSSLSNELQLRGRPSLVAKTRELLQPKIDLRRAALNGATYRILYEEQWLDRDMIGTGKILAVEISTGKHRYNAYRFTDADGGSTYYDERGQALQGKQMMILPCSYDHISSKFGYRTHPIRRTVHFHGGVDFAAPLGTPVKAIADGRVIFRGRKGGAGNMITIAHNGGMHTQYLHLSRFSSLCAFGKSVQQGDVIGYVGSTGSSTGPHLDFRVIVNDRARDPMAVLQAHAPQRRLSPAELGGLLAKIDLYHSRLDQSQIRVATISQRPSVLL
ncbi:MAG: M23 family metallopeptidase [Chlorobiaceae bacterium]|nr:M23 family metallopeptidase [Chlorobiaceae bacterium]